MDTPEVMHTQMFLGGGGGVTDTAKLNLELADHCPLSSVKEYRRTKEGGSKNRGSI